ncbi:FtsX-like permease family protein [Terrisporobacter sp.]|uniref:FtsX-like permease family protein n=1 Tax=Terrisporobacter sp. TaxID=1965305 RepID=UPI002622AE98|nr:FtsX-like permease family protein [Terrisporobacter sp.]
MYLGDSNDTIVNQALTLSKEEVDFKFDTEVMIVETNENPNEMGAIPYTDDVDLIKYSEVEKICEYRKLENENKFLNTKLKDNEAIFLIPGNLINAFNFNVDFKLGDKNISIIDSYTMNLFGTFRDGRPIIIVNDDTYDSISKILGSEKDSISCITLKNFENTANISKYIEENSNIHVYSVDNFDKESYNFVNSIYFIGLFLSLVFIVSVGSIMYFKCISDASKDKPRFDTLRKIGTSQEYINKSIFKQVGIFFLLPGLVAIIHSIVAGYSVASFFNQDGKISTLITILVFSLIYLIYYLVTAKKYINLTK